MKGVLPEGKVEPKGGKGISPSGELSVALQVKVAAAFGSTQPVDDVESRLRAATNKLAVAEDTALLYEPPAKNAGSSAHPGILKTLRIVYIVQVWKHLQGGLDACGKWPIVSLF